MHIPDGFLSTPVWGTSAAISIGYLSFIIRKLKRRLKERLIPVMGVLAAFIFAAQMLNFPVAGGTSGHLIGGVLAAVIAGPLAASFILTIVLIVQALIFQDGGLTALGANILNLAIIGTLGGYSLVIFISAFLKRVLKQKKANVISWAFGAWFSVVIASVACSIELALSKTAPLKIVLPAMISIHAIIGIGEALITVVALSMLRRVRPDLVESTDET